jgi:hypothetical protein
MEIGEYRIKLVFLFVDFSRVNQQSPFHRSEYQLVFICSETCVLNIFSGCKPVILVITLHFTASPAHYENDVSVNPVLTWKPGSGTEYHTVYFGASNPPELIFDQATSKYLPGTLDHSTSYYWGIDEVNSNGITTGQVWKFITEPSTSVENMADWKDKLPFDIYPNPVTGKRVTLGFTVEAVSEMTISLYDLYG